jgi:hypothetical protein
MAALTAQHFHSLKIGQAIIEAAKGGRGCESAKSAYGN